MPTVQFVNQAKGIRVTRDMPTPKRIGEIRYWLKGAQAAIKEIPRQIFESQTMVFNLLGDDGWFVKNTDVDVKWIKFNLENKFGERADIVINRQTATMR